MKLLVASDLSHRSDLAIAQAGFLTGQSGASLTILHVVDSDLPERVFQSECEQALRVLQEAAGRLDSAVQSRTEVRVVGGLDFQEILATARQDAVDLIVLGAHRRNIILDVLTGTTVERVIRSAPAPVLVVRRPLPGDYACTLAALDLSEEATEVVRMASRLAAGRTLYVTHTIDDAAGLQMAMVGVDSDHVARHKKALEANCRGLLNAIVRRAGGDALPLVGWGQPVPQIMEAVQQFGVQLAAVGTQTHAKGGMSRFLLGSVAEQLLLDLPCDVLAVPLAGCTPLPGADMIAILG